jgi:hypothetical protein
MGAVLVFATIFVVSHVAKALWSHFVKNRLRRRRASAR